MAGCDDAAERERIARDLRDLLEIPDPSRVQGKRIVVFDDVFTRGTTLQEVARSLKKAGAIGVVGLVLAREPWAY